jgi:hypothetical protein
MPEVVNQYTHTFIGQAIGSTYKFNLPMIPKLRENNYFEIQVCQIGMRRFGASAPHDIFFLVADIQGAQSQIITPAGQIDSRVNLGTIVNYDSGTSPANLTSPSSVEFKLRTFQPANPFTVQLYRLASQELANGFYSVLTPPSTLVPIGTIVNAQFIGGIGVTAPGSGSGTNLTVTEMLSPSNNLAVGQIITMEGFSPVVITALVTGTGGTGTYTVSAARDTGSQLGISTSTDTINNSQMIMTWIIKEMSPYEVNKGEVISY